MLGQAVPRLRTNVKPFVRKGQNFQFVKARFKSLKKLGQGAFGAAYAAKLDGKPVIVKTAVGTRGLVSPLSAVKSMQHETKVLAKLQEYPWIPRLIEVGVDYFVQEDVNGVSLLQLLAKKGVPARSLLSTVVSSGIIASTIHRDGVAHNDLEPRNILLTPEGVVVIDFGIAVLKEDGTRIFQEAMERDIISLLESTALVLADVQVPTSVKIMILSTIEKFRKIILSGKVDEDTAQQLSRELLFAVAQLGARAIRNGKVKESGIKVRVV